MSAVLSSPVSAELGRDEGSSEAKPGQKFCFFVIVGFVFSTSRVLRVARASPRQVLPSQDIRGRADWGTRGAAHTWCTEAARDAASGLQFRSRSGLFARPGHTHVPLF